MQRWCDGVNFTAVLNEAWLFLVYSPAMNSWELGRRRPCGEAPHRHTLELGAVAKGNEGI